MAKKKSCKIEPRMFSGIYKCDKCGYRFISSSGWEPESPNVQINCPCCGGVETAELKGNALPTFDQDE